MPSAPDTDASVGERSLPTGERPASETVTGADREPTPFTVYHATEGDSYVEGGVKVSAHQQRTALERANVRIVTDDPDDYDILHLNFPGPVSLYRLLAAKRAGKRVVVHAHSVGENIAGTYRFSHAAAPFINRYFAWFYRQADAVVAVSEYMRERLAENGVTDNVTVVSNGVNGAALDGYDDLCVGDRYGVSEPVVVNLAQVYAIKGVSDFVRVGEALSEVDFCWFGPQHRYLTPRETRRAVEDAPANVCFPGFVEDKREAFALGDVFFFPTHRDNQPLSILEAMYCGLPIVTRDIPAFSGWLEHGENCLKGDCPAAFAAHIRRLRDDPDLRERLGRNAAEDAADHTLGAVGRQLRAVYESVLA